ncbi:MAG TPA: hypothetical protein VG426_10740 [Candidatus Dormibacteraeota bacterium]|nr:hypothetical protein [Candidatus Dormibacteraeota bacterium]
MVHLESGNLHLDRKEIESWHDAVLGIVADFRITVDDIDIYHEVEFPVLELAYQMHRWLVCGIAHGEDLEYESMESETSPLIWFRRDGGKWSIGAVHQMHPSGVVERRDLESAAQEFITGLDKSVRTLFGLSLLSVLVDGVAKA